MSKNKQTVDEHIDGFRKTDHEQILSCLTDDIEWTIFGAFKLKGKEAYDKEIENEAFVGRPDLRIIRTDQRASCVNASTANAAVPRVAPTLRSQRAESTRSRH